MKLSKDDIQFIDTYLENSDFRHVDIRMEMLDHVATAIEKEIAEGDKRPFIKVFKDYMVKNKMDLINSKHKFVKAALMKNLKLIAKFCFSTKGVAVEVVIFCLIYFGLIHYDVDTIKKILYLATIGVFIFPMLTYFILIYVLKLQKVSSVDRLGVVFTVFFQFVNFANLMTREKEAWTASPVLIAVLISIVFTLSFAFTIVGYQVIKNA